MMDMLSTTIVQQVKSYYTVVSIAGNQATIELNGQLKTVSNDGFIIGQQVLCDGFTARKMPGEVSVFEI